MLGQILRRPTPPARPDGAPARHSAAPPPARALPTTRSAPGAREREQEREQLELTNIPVVDNLIAKIDGGRLEQGVRRAVGIDLGTTYSAVAYIDRFGKPLIVKNSDGLNTTPSVVYINDSCFVVGEYALQSTLSEPERVVQFVKRFMGVPDYRVKMDEHRLSPEFISSVILRKLVQEAEITLGESITHAVITVPAYFTESQRGATYEAAQLAGLQVLRIIAEPTAAALHYGMNQRGNRTRVLVYDLGGGTFDVTILQVDGDELNVIGVGGDARLGGKDFDERLMNFVEARLKSLYGDGMHVDALVEAELRLKCEQAKRQMGGRPVVPINFKAKKIERHPGGEHASYVPVRIEVSREEFEMLCADLITRTELLVNSVLYKARMTWDDVDEVLCVGGSSRMPMVREMLTRVTGKRPLLQDPDECIALGAAIQAGLLSGQEGLEPMKIGHVLSHSLGVLAIRDGAPVIDRLIPALTPLPCAKSQACYTTTDDFQTTVQVAVYEGESADPEAYANGPIGVFELDASPPRAKGVPRISVEFRCDENGRVTAFARDLETGVEGRAMISLVGARSSQEKLVEAQLLSLAVIS